MFDLQAYLRAKRERINSAIQRALGDIGGNGLIFDAMRYAIDAGGKRLRPILSLAAAESVGGREADVMDAACAIELIHTYSLIHDDLPAMDNDALRRGLPTLHVRFDEATAILAGDALLTLAFEILSSPARPADRPARIRLQLVGILANAAGCRGMIEGQMQDVHSEGKKLTIDELEAIHHLKTGALIEASIHVGALLGNARDGEIECLRRYGRHIGLAFQVMDDILNVKGDPLLMGKAVGSDEAKGKNTYPALMGTAASEAYATRLVESGLQALHEFDKKADPLRAIGRYIVERRK